MVAGAGRWIVKTDIPLTRLMALRGADLLPLLGLPAAMLLRVERRALPASATRLDPVVRVRSPQGQDYLHIVAWQGYPDCAAAGVSSPGPPVRRSAVGAGTGAAAPRIG
jgi:hypothetical protein